jgi:hypothetical protein
LDQDNLDLFPSSAGHPNDHHTPGLEDKHDQELETAFQIEMESEDGSTHTITLPAINPSDILRSSSVISSRLKRSRGDEMTSIAQVSGDHKTTIRANSSSDLATTETTSHQVLEGLPDIPSSTYFAYPAFGPLEWLASVTEKINQTMHYGFPEQPDPLLFHVPQTFFNFLMDRYVFIRVPQ